MTGPGRKVRAHGFLVDASHIYAIRPPTIVHPQSLRCLVRPKATTRLRNKTGSSCKLCPLLLLCERLNEPFPSVLGPFGSGKSSVGALLSLYFSVSGLPAQFIEYAIRRPGQIVGHGLQSSMTDIQTFRTTHPIDGRPVVFVDTPGFDDKCRSVTEIWSMIAHWLAKT
jgi:hypothetical protein